MISLYIAPAFGLLSLSLDTYLSIIGGFFLISMIASFFLDERLDVTAVYRKFTVDKLIRFLGIVGLMAVICVGFGFGSWIFSYIYVTVIEWVTWLLGIH